MLGTPRGFVCSGFVKGVTSHVASAASGEAGYVNGRCHSCGLHYESQGRIGTPHSVVPTRRDDDKCVGPVELQANPWYTQAGAIKK